jgi:2'-5' RNA ligase
LVEGCLSEENKNAKVLARLAAIQERFLRIRISKTRAFHQGLFWVKVDQKLEKLGLEEEVQQALEAQISEKVPRPGDDWALWGVTCIPQIDC